MFFYFKNYYFRAIYKFDLYFNPATLCILKNNDILIWDKPLFNKKYYHYEYLNK